MLPVSMAGGVASVLGWVLYVMPSRRKRILLSNLHHAFPEKSEAWRRRIARVSCSRTIEMGLFNIVSSHFSQERYQRCLEMDPEGEQAFEEALKEGRPMLFLGAHFSMVEAFNAWPAVSRFPMPEMGVLYRPYKHPRIDALIKRNRQRCGARLFSRREGFAEFGKILSRGGCGAILFDQNSGRMGSLIPFFGKVSSATELPGLFAKKYRAIVWMGHLERLSLFKARFHLIRLDGDMSDSRAVTLASNAWLEDRLRANDDWCADWLWTHNRWKILHRAPVCLSMQHKKVLVDFGSLPDRKTRIWLCMRKVSDCGESIQAFVTALRASRPDASVTLLAEDATGFSRTFPGVVDSTVDLPIASGKAWAKAWDLRGEYPDICLILEDDTWLRVLVRVLGAPLRIGVRNRTSSPGAWLTNAWKLPEGVGSSSTGTLLAFGREFGMQIPGEPVKEASGESGDPDE